MKVGLGWAEPPDSNPLFSNAFYSYLRFAQMADRNHGSAFQVHERTPAKRTYNEYEAYLGLGGLESEDSSIQSNGCTRVSRGSPALVGWHALE